VTRPGLSLFTVTANSAERLGDWLTLALEFADELVVGVDEISSDGTEEIARQFADRVFVFEHSPNQVVAFDWGMRQATGDWILTLFDDEYMSRSFASTVPSLISDPYFTHYLIPRRWVVRGDFGEYEWLNAPPWQPEWTLRLIRNIGGMFHHSGRLHDAVDIGGEGRTLRPEEATIYHMDLAWRSREQRQAKLQRYAQITTDDGDSLYLYEDQPGAGSRAPVPPGELDREPSEVARQRASGRMSQAPPRLRRAEPSVPLGRLLLSTATWQTDLPVFQADYIKCRIPEKLITNCAYRADLVVRNPGFARWPGPNAAVPLRVGFRWRDLTGQLVSSQDIHTIVPVAFAPGESHELEVGMWTPFQPGCYRLEWDLLVEGVAWFSERGVQPLVVDVEVGAAPTPGALPDRSTSL
jgi:hypothetical protein